MSEHRYPATMHVSQEMADAIAQNVDRALISSRTGRGTDVVHYLKGDIVSDALNEVFGTLGWGLVAKIHQIDDWEEEKSGGRDGGSKNMHVVQVISDVTLTIKRTNVDSSDTIFTQPGMGYGEIEVGKNRKEAVGMAVKGAATDGLKRCANMLGPKFGLLMASNGKQEDVEYAHNGKAPALRAARQLRDGGNGTRGNDRQDERGSGQQSRDRQPQHDRTDGDRGRGRSEAPRTQTARGQDEGRGRSDVRNDDRTQDKARQDAPRSDERQPDQRPAEPARQEQPRQDDRQQDRRPDETRNEKAATGKAEEGGASAASGEAVRAPRRTANTDFDLNSLPVAQDEMTDFAATLVARVKEMRQESDRIALVKQHLNTVQNLDSKIRRRLIERLREANVDVDTIRA